MHIWFQYFWQGKKLVVRCLPCRGNCYFLVVMKQGYIYKYLNVRIENKYLFPLFPTVVNTIWNTRWIMKNLIYHGSGIEEKYTIRLKVNTSRYSFNFHKSLGRIKCISVLRLSNTNKQNSKVWTQKWDFRNTGVVVK